METLTLEKNYNKSVRQHGLFFLLSFTAGTLGCISLSGLKETLLSLDCQFTLWLWFLTYFSSRPLTLPASKIKDLGPCHGAVMSHVKAFSPRKKGLLVSAVLLAFILPGLQNLNLWQKMSLTAYALCIIQLVFFLPRYRKVLKVYDQGLLINTTFVPWSTLKGYDIRRVQPVLSKKEDKTYLVIQRHCCSYFDDSLHIALCPETALKIYDLIKERKSAYEKNKITFN